MVTITIFIEGGVLPNPNLRIQTVNNSQALREGFYKLFSQKLSPTDFQLIIKVSSSNKQTVKFFKTAQETEKESCIFLDLDGSPITRIEKLKEFGLSANEKQVFFMIQEMEAWMLSQPDKIECCYQNLKRTKPTKPIAADSTIHNKALVDIQKPSKKLHTLLGRYFAMEKRGKFKKKKYKKLEDGASLLALLDLKQLAKDFEDVANFLSYMTSYQKNNL